MWQICLAVLPLFLLKSQFPSRPFRIALTLGVIVNRWVVWSSIGYVSLRSERMISVTVTEVTANWGYFSWKLWWTMLCDSSGEIAWHNKKKIVEARARRCQSEAAKQTQPLTSSLPLFIFLHSFALCFPFHQGTFKWTQGECSCDDWSSIVSAAFIFPPFLRMMPVKVVFTSVVYWVNCGSRCISAYP